jgi:tRNA1(Val) A37 N6-methylase TrmN6
MKDSFYTPKILADKLVGYIKKKSFTTAVDFCVGDGELIRSAKSRWPEIECFGFDISQQAINQTRLNHPDWYLSQLDFLDNIAREESEILQVRPKYDLILLNPPFSCKGGTMHNIVFEGRNFSVSTAMKFLIIALQYVSRDGVMYAILPTSTAYSQKDKALWLLLEKKYNLSILEEPQYQYFKECAPNVILVSLNDFSQISKYKNVSRIPLEFNDLKVLRGKLSMNLIGPNKGKYFLVHSTNLKNNSLVNLSLKQTNIISVVTGPAILIPRVGKPNISKICIIKPQETYVISDCIIAIKTSKIKDTELLYRYIIDNWPLVEDMYKGTGAKYITIEKLNQFLNLDTLHNDYMNVVAI